VWVNPSQSKWEVGEYDFAAATLKLGQWGWVTSLNTTKRNVEYMQDKTPGLIEDNILNVNDWGLWPNKKFNRWDYPRKSPLYVDVGSSSYKSENFQKMEDSYIRLESPGISQRSISTLECIILQIYVWNEILAALSFASRLVVRLSCLLLLTYHWTCCVEASKRVDKPAQGLPGMGDVWRLKHWVRYCFLNFLFCLHHKEPAKPYIIPLLLEVKLTSILPTASHDTCSITNEFPLVHFNCA